MMIDAHIHLTHHKFSNQFPFLNGDLLVETNGKREKLIERMQNEGVEACIEPAIGIDSNERILKLAEAYPGFVYAAIGVHPTRTYKYVTGAGSDKQTKLLRWRDRKLIKQHIDHPAVVAIGETGLDFHQKFGQQHRLRQINWFIWHIILADWKQKPLILHVRKADHTALFILRRFRHLLHGGVVHCFQGNAKLAKAYTDLGFKLGIGGALLKAAPSLPELEKVVAETKIQDLLLETDAPYVKPSCPGISKRRLEKVRNTSLILPVIAKRVGELKGISTEEVLRVTAVNANQLFHLGKKLPAPAMPEALKAIGLISEQAWEEAIDFPKEWVLKDPLLAHLLDQVDAYPMLLPEKEAELLREGLERSLDSTDLLMGAYGRFMLACIKQYYQEGEDSLSDMIMEGWLALLQGQSKYNPDTGKPYAVFIAQMLITNIRNYKTTQMRFRCMMAHKYDFDLFERPEATEEET